MSPNSCPLCKAGAEWFFTDAKSQARHFHCAQCDLRFLDPTQRLNSSDEIERYRLHKNDVTATDYQNFVSPLTDWLASLYPCGSRGLDFGCGTAPILAFMLRKHGLKMFEYDPYFAADASALKESYDFVVASEVVEHFYSPATEFSRLRELIKPGGHLGLMTLLVPENVHFESWHYRRDPTHVVFYSRRTLAWVRHQFDFAGLEIRGDRTILLKVPAN